MDLDRKIELLDEAIGILFLLNEDLVSLEKIKEINDVLVIYSSHWKCEENVKRLRGWLDMHEELLDDAYNYLNKITRKEAREERSYEVAKDMIKEGFSADIISKISRLDISVVNQLMLMK